MPTTYQIEMPSPEVRAELIEGAVTITREHVKAFMALAKEFNAELHESEIIEFASSIYMAALSG